MSGDIVLELKCSTHAMMVALTWQERVMFSPGHTECTVGDAVTTESNYYTIKD